MPFLSAFPESPPPPFFFFFFFGPARFVGGLLAGFSPPGGLVVPLLSSCLVGGSAGLMLYPTSLANSGW